MPEPVQKYIKRQKLFEGENGLAPGFWILLKSKLTHSLAERQSKIASIDLLAESFNVQDTAVFIEIYAEENPKIETRNVVGFSKGSISSDSNIVVCAHYDHLGALGKSVYFPGANDNASGVSMMLEMAYQYGKRPHKFNIVFIAFSGEEAGLLGSYYFVNHPMVPLNTIKFVLNLDLMGFGDKGATVVNGTIHPAQFKILADENKKLNFLPVVNSRGQASNSDHYPFSEMNIPAFFMYTLGGPGFYHDVFDQPETITFSGFQPTFKLLSAFLDRLQE